MELKIQTIRFDATEKLQNFIQKKMSKLDRTGQSIKEADITMRVTRPEATQNKETSIRLIAPGGELFATKVCDTFEEGIDSCLDALRKQLEKYKSKKEKDKKTEK